MASPPSGQGRDAPPSSAPLGAPEPRPVRRRGHLRTYLFTGIIVAAPISITIYLTIAFINFVDARVTPLIPDRYNPESYLPFSVPGLGVVIVLLVLIALGALTTNFAGRSLVAFGERIVSRVPVVRSIYSLFKQIFETLLSEGRGSFQKVGLIQHPRPGLWSVVFIATQVKGEISDHVEDEVVSVFLPTIPNPTTGFLLFVPRKEIVVLDMTVEEAAKLVLSAGLVVPERAEPAAVPAATLEAMLKQTPDKPGPEPEVVGGSPGRNA